MLWIFNVGKQNCVWSDKHLMSPMVHDFVLDHQDQSLFDIVITVMTHLICFDVWEFAINLTAFSTNNIPKKNTKNK